MRKKNDGQAEDQGLEPGERMENELNGRGQQMELQTENREWV